MRKLLVVMVVLLVSNAYADVFNTNNPAGTGAISFNIDFVDVGDAGNAATDSSYYMWGGSSWVQAPGLGNVAYDYRIGKTEITVGQINAMFYALGDSVDLTSGMAAGGVNTMHMLMYANWLNAGCPGDAGTSMMNGGVYNFTSWGTIEPWAEADQWDNGDGTKNIWRHKDAQYFLPSVDEWFKAANYKGGSTDAGYWLYPTSIDNATAEVPPGTTTYSANYNNVLTGAVDAGSYPNTQSPYGALDMAGNLWDLCEVVGDGTSTPTMTGLGGAYWLNSRYLRNQTAYPFDRTYGDVGFRIASVPEPLTMLFLSLGALFGLKRKQS